MSHHGYLTTDQVLCLSADILIALHQFPTDINTYTCLNVRLSEQQLFMDLRHAGDIEGKQIK